MAGTLFVLGRSTALCFSELQNYFPNATLIASSIAYIPEQIDASYYMTVLAGTVKIATILEKVDALNEDDFVRHLRSYGKDSKITFGISSFGVDTRALPSLRQIKESLHSQGISARYVEHDANEVSSVVVSKQHVCELIVVKVAEGYLFAKTDAVQNFADWSTRDWLRPSVDPQKGMLPPKIARMVVSIAKKYINNDTPLLVDPFCGVGTILSEALLVGYSVIGADIDANALQKATKNVDWICKKYTVRGSFSCIQSDATALSHFIHQPVDAIVTEPFMGNPKLTQYQHIPSVETVKNVIKGLEKLYIGALKDWHTMLVPEGIVCIALPEYNIYGKAYFVKKVIDRCEILGYTLAEGPYEYSRPQAIVKRKFYVLKKI